MWLLRVLQAVGGLPVIVTDSSVTIESAPRLLAAVCVWAVLASANFTSTFIAAAAGVLRWAITSFEQFLDVQHYM